MKEKFFMALGAVVTIAALGYVAYDRWSYVFEKTARKEGVGAAAIGTVCGFVALLVFISFWISLPSLWRWFRGKNRA